MISPTGSALLNGLTGAAAAVRRHWQLCSGRWRLRRWNGATVSGNFWFDRTSPFALPSAATEVSTFGQVSAVAPWRITQFGLKPPF